jgi:hypothetical protein
MCILRDDVMTRRRARPPPPPRRSPRIDLGRNAFSTDSQDNRPGEPVSRRSAGSVSRGDVTPAVKVVLTNRRRLGTLGTVGP